MGNTTTTTNSSQQATPTAEERTLLQQQAANNAFMMPIAQKSYADLAANIQAILEGRDPMAQGVGGITEGQTQSMVNASLRDIMPQFQANGILNSGESAQIANRTAADVRNQNAQFNVSAAQNLFNLAAGGQSNLQNQYQGSQNSYGNQLAGLRTISGNSSVSKNPFLESFYSGVGKTAGNIPGAALSAIPGGGAFSSAIGGCWVAAEIFDGWSDFRTISARFYIMFHAPKWFRNMYIKFGENIAKFIHNKPILKNAIKPLFELFASKGKEKLNGR